MESAVEFGALNYAILVGYLMLMFGIGLAFAGRQQSTEDYFLAGRNMPWLVVAMSMFASVTSATSYIGVPGTAYAENISLLMVGVASVLAAPVLVCLFFPFYRRLKVTTSYEYIDQRFGRPARYTTSGLFVLARLGWLGVVIYSPALAISEVTGLNLYLAIVLMGAFGNLIHLVGRSVGRALDRCGSVHRVGWRGGLGGLDLDFLGTQRHTRHYSGGRSTRSSDALGVKSV